jgi:hypothetical protein
MSQGYLRSYTSIGGSEGDPPVTIGKIKVRVKPKGLSLIVLVDIFDENGNVRYSLPEQNLGAGGGTLILDMPK